jgi:TonB family protein
LSRKVISIILILVLVCVCGATSLAGGAWWRFAGRPQPAPASQELFSGVTYTREVRNTPRPVVIHTLQVDLRDPGVRLLVTPGDPDAEHSLQARTTSGFLEEFDLQLAVNGDGFVPWYSNTIFSYYPHKGDPIDPIGLAASQGTLYAQGNGAEPTLYISRTNRARFNEPIGVTFTILADGSVADVQVTKPSQATLLNIAAQRAVLSAGPFGPLPREYGTNRYTSQAIFKTTS